MKKNGQLKAIVTYGMRDWEANLPAACAGQEPKGYVTLGKRASAEGPAVLLRLNEQGLAEPMEGALDAKALVQGVLDAVASQTRAGRVPATAEVLARWEIPVPEQLPEQDAPRFCALTYQYLVRTAGIEIELCGIASESALELWFVPASRDNRSQLQLSLRGLLSRSEYLDLYEGLRAYLADELGYEVDVDADDVMFRELGYTEDERRSAIAEREEAKLSAQEMGATLQQEAQDYAEVFAKSFRQKLRR